MRKKSTRVEERTFLVAKDALSHSEYFKTFLEWIQDQMNENLLLLQSPDVINCTNRHFMVSGKIEAFDEIYDEMTKFVDR